MLWRCYVRQAKLAAKSSNGWCSSSCCCSSCWGDFVKLGGGRPTSRTSWSYTPLVVTRHIAILHFLSIMFCSQSQPNLILLPVFIHYTYTVRHSQCCHLTQFHTSIILGLSKCMYTLCFKRCTSVKNNFTLYNLYIPCDQ